MTTEPDESSVAAGPLTDCTAFQRDILAVLEQVGDKPHGLAIKDELEVYYQNGINHGRLYPNLDTLVDKGLIEKGKLDNRTNYYQLTRRGKRELGADHDWRS